MTRHPYFTPGEVLDFLTGSNIGCVNLREIHYNRAPFEWEELPESSFRHALSPPPYCEGQEAVFYRYNKLSGQLMTVQRAWSVTSGGRLAWWFDAELPVRGVGTFVCD